MLKFSRPTVLGDELKSIGEALTNWHNGGETFCQKAEKLLQAALRSERPVLLTPSCTAALEMAALLSQIEPGDEIIVPSFTFVSTANAFALFGAKPVFADIDPDTLGITATEVSRLVSPSTRAVIVLHYAGFPCGIEEIGLVTRQHNLLLVEDAAHALGSIVNGKPLGTIGDLGTFSFHETKNLTCGEGGALVVNNPSLIDRAYTIRDKGTNRRSFLRKEAAFYSWIDLGSSYTMSEILAAMLYAQLSQLKAVTARRRLLWMLYRDLLRDLNKRGVLTYPTGWNIENASAHIFFILLDSEKVRDDLQRYLLTRGIESVFHYQPLHQSSMVVKRWGAQGSLPVTESIAQRILRLPLHDSLTTDQVCGVACAIKKFFTS